MVKYQHTMVKYQHAIKMILMVQLWYMIKHATNIGIHVVQQKHILQFY